jgi:hypothetical protein
MKKALTNIIAKVNEHSKLIISVLVAILAILFGSITLVKTNEFFDKNYLQFNQIIKVVFQKPIEIKKRVPIIQKIVLDYPKEIDTPLKKYICDKFGPYDCKTALAIADAESGFQEQVVHINTNNTIDVGIFQINEVHFKQAGCSLKEIVDAYKNVDCAFGIFQGSGWGPWTTYTNGSYLISYGK